MLKYVLLGFLTYQEASGYDLKQLLDGFVSKFWHAEQSQIYTTLKRLEKDGLVFSHIEFQESHPNRRVYEITESGRANLRDWLTQPLMAIEPYKETLLLKLFFAAQLDPQAILTQLRSQRNLRKSQLGKYQTTTKFAIHQFVASADMAGDTCLWEAILRFGELYEEMFIRWLDETIEMIVV